MAYFCHLKYNEENTTKRVALYEGIDGSEVMEVVRAAFGLKSSSVRLRDRETGTIFTSKDFDETPRHVAKILRKSNDVVVEEEDEGDKPSYTKSSSRTLSDLNILEAVRAFKFVTQKQGHDRMNRNAFSEFLGRIRVDADEAIVENVFRMIDSDGNGEIDGKELISGLTVLCAGDRDTKIRAAFVLYDKNDDGFIDEEELKSYLRSVFRVVAQTDPEKFRDKNVTPESLADATAKQCFMDCDSNDDGLLSLDEFKTWYTASVGNDGEEEEEEEEDELYEEKEGEEKQSQTTTVVSLEELRERTGLDTVSCEQVLELFENKRPTKSMNRKEFYAFVDRIPVSEEMKTQDARDLMHSLFDIFDQNDDNVIDPRELMAGLTVLLEGTQKQKIKAAFQMYDEDSSGFIEYKEMLQYLTSVFLVLFRTTPEIRNKIGMSARELAEETTLSCFRHCDVNRDGKLSLMEFELWYSKSSGPEGNTVRRAERLYELERLKELTTLPQEHVSDVLPTFIGAAGDDASISREAFLEAMSYYVKEKSPFVTKLLIKLFNEFDDKNEGVIDCVDLASGLSVLTAGSSDEKVESVFAMLDLDDDKWITEEEMRRYLRSIFKVLYKASPGQVQDIEVTPDELARLTASQCFETVTKKNGKKLMSLDEFKDWYGKPTSDNSLQKMIDTAPKMMSLDETRRLVGLSNTSFDSLREALEYRTDSSGFLNRRGFDAVFLSLLRDDQKQSLSEEDKIRRRIILSGLFDLFDADGSGTVSVDEITVGLTVLCGGDHSSKAQRAFQIYDLDDDGFITRDEFLEFLRSIFRVLYHAEPDTEEVMGMSCNELARATVEEAFKEADLNNDSKLSLEEFVKWYGGSTNNMNISQDIQDATEKAAKKISLAELRRITHLGNTSVHDVFEIFAEATSPDGTISREAFNQCFKVLASSSGFTRPSSSDAAKLRLALSGLYDLFDTDGDGDVSFEELTSGLSILCQGSRDDKSAAAFSLYDQNGDGVISASEMIQYLTSVFKIMFHAEPEAQIEMACTAEELAEATTRHAFEEADKDHDNTLSYSEFRSWYANNSNDTDDDDNILLDVSESPSSSSKVAKSVKKFESIAAQSLRDTLSLDDLKRITCLGNLHIRDAVKKFTDVCDSDGTISRSAFFKVLGELGRASGRGDQLRIVLGNLYQIFDIDHNDVVDQAEIVASLSVLCQGSSLDKARVAFEVFAYDDGSDKITREQMKKYVRSIFAVMLSCTAGMNIANIEELADATAERAFVDSKVDFNSDDAGLTFEQFRTWCCERIQDSFKSATSPKYTKSRDISRRDSTLSTSSSTDSEFMDTNDGGFKTNVLSEYSIQEVRQITGLESAQYIDVVDMIASVVDDEGSISRSDFETCFETILEDCTSDMTEAKESRLRDILTGLYSIFARDFHGIDFTEFSCALSIFCAGTVDDRVDSIFALFDWSQKNTMGFEDLQCYFTSVLRVMMSTRDGQGISNASPEHLGQRAAEDAYRTLSLAKSEKMSFDQFKTWYSTFDLGSFPSHNGNQRSPKKKEENDTLSLPELRMLTHLNDMSVKDLERFWNSYVDSQGNLNRTQFSQGFSELIHLDRMSEMDAVRVRNTLVGLYDSFDVDGDGTISHKELITGLSMLCGADSSENNCRYAFELHDKDNSGFLSFDEFQSYLRSMFNTMMNSDRSTFDKGVFGVDSNGLASATAELAFKEAGIDLKDGKMSYNQFLKFYKKDAHDVRAQVHESTSDSDKEVEEDDVRFDYGLENLGVSEMFEMFASITEKDGTISEENFHKVMRPRSSASISSLFRLFGTDRADFVDLCTGLTVLCGGNHADKAIAAYDLYDVKQGGYITKDDLERFLSSIFKVMFHVDRDARERAGCSAEQLARATCIDAFKKAGLDDIMSFEDFKHWYDQGSSGRSSSDEEDEDLEEEDDELESECRTTTLERYRSALHSLDINDAFEDLAAMTRDNGTISRTALRSCFAKWDPKHLVDCDGIFDVFNRDLDEDFIDFRELASGITVLCGGSYEYRVESAFALYDLNGDGVITRDELSKMMESIFKVLFHIDPSYRERLGNLEAADLAKNTASDAFDEWDVDHSGTLTFEEFFHYYTSPDPENLLTPSPPVSLKKQPKQGSSPLSRIAEMRELTGLYAMSVESTMEMFSIVTDENGMIDRESFESCFDIITSQLDAPIATHKTHKERRLVVNELFDLFDTNGDDKVDYHELTAGLTILCSGSRHEKAYCAFLLYDTNDDGVISMQEFINYMTSVFKVMFTAEPESAKRMGTSPENLAIATAKHAFESADKNLDGVLSYEEFRDWYESVKYNEESSLNSEDDYEEQGQEDERRNDFIMSLEEFSKLTGLNRIPVSHIFEIFAESTNENGLITRDEFNNCFARIAEESNSRFDNKDADRLLAMLDRVFDMFDTSQDEGIDYLELVSGLSVMCTSTSKLERARAAFELFDYNEDSHIDCDELTIYIMSVFRFVAQTRVERFEALNTSPEMLARATAEMAFREFNLDPVDERMSYKVFSEWIASFTGYVTEEEEEEVDDEEEENEKEKRTISVDEIRYLTGLGETNVIDAVRGFTDVMEMDEKFNVSRQAFEAGINEMCANRSAFLGAKDLQRLREGMSDMFNWFDTDGSGEVSSAELVGGLTVLCKPGDTHDKAELLLSMYDLDEDGAISREELRRYLFSVFTVLYKSNPEIKQEIGCDALDLAEVSADDAFEMFATKSNKMSIVEFREWLKSTQGGTTSELSRRAASSFTLREIREITGLEKLSLSEILEIFSEATDLENGTISLAAFTDCMSEIAGHLGHVKDEDTFRLVVFEIFSLFDEDNSNTVDMVELSSGMGVLAGGDVDEKIEAAFKLYDFDENGKISKNEMIHHLEAVYKVMYHADSNIQEKIGMTPRELAEQTTSEAFAMSDLNNDETLSFEEFRNWMLEGFKGGTSSNIVSGAQKEATSKMTLGEVRRLTGLENYPLDTIVKMFKSNYMDEDEDMISRESLIEFFTDLVERRNPTNEERERVKVMLGGLYELFDTDDDGTVSASELVAGISVLCGGSRDRKAERVFNMFDIDGSNSISFEEFCRMLFATFKVIYAAEPDTEKEMGCSALDLAIVTAESAFEDADLNHDGELSLEEFRRWYSSDSSVAVSNIIDQGSSKLTLDETRRVSRLDRFTFTEIKEVFKAGCNSDGTISREAFVDCFAEIAGAVIGDGEIDLDDEDEFRVLVSNLYNVFDTDRNGVLDIREILSGLSVLCATLPNEEDKINSTFKMYDANNDGTISQSELIAHMHAVFKLMCETSEGQESTEFTPLELATATAKSVFEEADVDKDEKLTLEEFQEWASKPDSSAQKIDTLRDTAVRRMDMNMLRSLTHLNAYPIKIAFTAFANYSDEHGLITRSNFMKCLMKLAEISQEDNETLAVAISALYDIFDTDSNGVVDLNELSSGLGLLCNGTPEEKGSASFELYDVNGDGVITYDEMVALLTSTFKILNHTSDSELPDAHILAEATAKAAFQEYDKDHNHVLTKDEFMSWYTETNNITEDPLEKTIYNEQEKNVINLEEILRLANFRSYDVSDIFEVFAARADSKGSLDYDAFAESIEELSSSRSEKRPDDEKRLVIAIKHLFRLFDGDANGSIDFVEMSSGISVLAGGSKNDRCEAAFALYDLDDSGFITLEEMTQYLTSVFRVMYGTMPDIRDKISFEVDTLARATAEEAFSQADLDSDGHLSLVEFRKWYDKHGMSDSAPGIVRPTKVTLSLLKNLTNFEAYSVNEILETFAGVVNENGAIDRDMFDTVVLKLAQNRERRDEPLTDKKIRLLRDCMDVLFKTFDSDMNGTVDFVELASGLSILCNDPSLDKSACAFNLYDYDGDGKISKDEMIRYLTSIFKVMYASESGVEDKMSGLTAENLAEATADGAFSEFDAHHKNYLTFQEFQKWHDSSRGTMESEVAKSTAETMTLGELKRLSGLGNLTVNETLARFRKFCKHDYVTRQEFYMCLRDIAKDIEMTHDEEDRLVLCLEGLYDLFDKNGDSKVSKKELVSGLVILCSDDKHDKARTSFKLFDLNGDSAIDIEEMTAYLKSVFQIVYHTDPRMEIEMECDAETLARRTAEHAFEEADLDHDSSLSFSEFQKWYIGSGQEINDIVTGASRQVSLSELKRLTRLESVSPDKLLHMFAERTNENGVIDRENFFECFLELAGDDLSKEDSTKLRVVLAGLYDLFDTNDQDGVDFAEIGSGFSILTGGKKDIKAAVAFSLYDVDDNGVISMDEMINYLESVFKILYHSHPGTEDEVGMNAKDLAIETAKEAFSRADKNHDSVLSYNEFCAWYSNTDLDCDEEEEEGEDVDGVVVKRLGILANLRAFEASEILQMFANRVSDRGNISYNVFHDIIESVSVTRDKPLTSHEKKMLDKKMKAIYESLDTNQDGQVQFSELAAGLTVLCGGTANSKIETAFELFDMNNDRMISQDEMFRYLRSVYAIVYEADSTARTRMGGADPDELALATTADAFERLGKGPGESLSFSEFKQWCELDDAKVVREASSKISLGEARRLTCLDSMRVHDVFECFMRRTTKSDGTISRRCFRETIEELSTMGGTRVLSDKDQDRLRVLISGLYDQFDVNNDGMCSTVEMISGLTILCGGDVEEKAKIAFDLYDTDRSGTISREEMQIHLKSVFRVVYHTDTQMAERTGVDVNVLSEETTRHAFENADLNPDGTMSYDAFRQWYLTTAAQEEEESKQENDNEEEGKSEESLDQTVVSSEESWITLEEIRRVTNLQYYDLDDIVNRFMEVADDDGRMDMSTFYNVMIEFATNKQETISSNDEEKLRHVLHHLFRIFDTNKDSRIDSGELIAGLSALVGGKRDKKTKIAFVLFDSSGDGYIQLEEMARYLYCVYRVIYAAEPSTKQRAGGLSEKQLAINTAKQAFEKADIDKDGKLSFEEFKAWYTGASDFASQMSNEVDDILMMSLDDVRNVLNIPENATVESLITHFMHFMGEDESVLSRSNFMEALSKWRDDDGDDEKSEVWTMVATRLYDLMDTSKNGDCEVIELISGLSTLLETDALGKFRSLFRLFAFEHDEISEAHMCRYLVCCYRVLLKFGNSTSKETSPEVLAYKKTKEIFSEAILTERGGISFDEFCRLYTMLTADGLLEKTSKAVESVPIDEIRHLMHLESHSVQDVLSRFENVTNQNGEISREDFETVLTGIAEEGNVEDPEMTRLAILYLFNLFDQDGNGSVNSNELRSGFSILCDGDPDTKAMAAFKLYDTNNDGILSKDEMISYLRSVFTVVYETKPEDVKELDVQDCTPSELAENTTNECFERLGIKSGNGLTFEQFRQWYDSTHDDDDDGGGGDDGPSSMEDLRRITGLGSFNVQDVMDIFRSSSSSELTKSEFVKTLGRIIDSAETQSSEKEIEKALHTLFDIFDSNDDGIVDTTELSCGLSVIVGGSAADKSRVAFDIIDTNQDNSISNDELQTYLRSVFNVMLLTGADLGDRSPEDLAEETSRECFEFNNVSLDKGISLSQFRGWYAEDDSESDDDDDNNSKRSRRSSAAIRNFNEYVQSNLSLEEMQKITGLDSFAPETVYVKFLQESTDGTIERRAFYKVLQEMAEFGGKQADPRLQGLLNVLFELFDSDSDDSLTLEEISTGLSVLCGGNASSKAKHMFDIFDSTGKGHVSIEDFEIILTNIFKIVYKANPETRENCGGKSPGDLAKETASQAFLSCDLDKNGNLSFEEFEKWYEGSSLGEILPMSPMAVAPTPTTPSLRTLPSIDRVKEITNLELLTHNEALLLFEDFMGEDQTLDYECFEAVMLELIESGDGEGADEAREILPSLFNVFDQDRDGLCNEDELSHALSLLVLTDDESADVDDAIQEIFSRIDRDNNSVISQSEFEKYLRSILAVLSVMDPYYKKISDLVDGVENLSCGIAEVLFSRIDLNTNTDGLTSGEWLLWFKSTELVDLVSSKKKNKKPSSDHWRNRLNIWRKAFDLGMVSASNLMDEFVELAQDGLVTLEHFGEVLTRGKEGKESLVKAFFDGVNVQDKEGKLKLRPLRIACAVLCGGSVSSRCSQLFDSLDVDQDDHLSKAETLEFFEVLFSLVSAAGTSGLFSLGMSSSDLANIVTNSIMSKSGTAKKFTREKFKDWFHTDLDMFTHSSFQRGSIVGNEMKIDADDVKDEEDEENKEMLPSQAAEEKTVDQQQQSGIELKEIHGKKSNIHVSRQGSIYMGSSNSTSGNHQPKIHVSRSGSIDISISPVKSSPSSNTMKQHSEDLLRLVWQSIDSEGTNKVSVKAIHDSLRENPKIMKLLSVSVDDKESFLTRLNRLTLDSARPITWHEFKRVMFISEREFQYFVDHNTIPGIKNLNNFQQYRVKILFEKISDFETTMSRDKFLTKMKLSALGESQGITFFDIMDSDKNDCVTLAEFAKFFDDIHDGSMDYDAFMEFVLDFEQVDKRPAAREV